MIRVGVCIVVVALAAPFVASSHERAEQAQVVLERVTSDGLVVVEHGIVAADEDVGFTRWYHHAKPDHAGKGGKGGNGGDGGDGGGNDCTSTKYRLTPWVWRAPVGFQATAYVDQFAAAVDVWDDAAAAGLGAGVVAGQGTAGVFDGVNQIDFGPLESSGTIAVTTTWYNRGSGEAFESDARYNSAYAWATDGSAGAMDVLNIAVHEIGHSFGLDHPRGGGASCLTMYAYAHLGETAKRTLGDGDIRGIRALYG